MQVTPDCGSVASGSAGSHLTATATAAATPALCLGQQSLGTCCCSGHSACASEAAARFCTSTWPLARTAWGPASESASACKRSLPGCVATALAQDEHLQLNGFNLQLSGEEGSQGHSLSASSSDVSLEAEPRVPSLRHLELCNVQLAGISSLLQLAAAPQLVTLKLVSGGFTGHSNICGDGTFCFASKPAAQQVAAAMPGLLQQLPLLSVLELPGLPVTGAAAQQLSAMRGLQHLVLEGVMHVPVGKLRHLPSSITCLKLQGQYDATCLPPDLPQLPGLLHLEASYCGVHPGALASCTQLQVSGWLQVAASRTRS